MLATDIVMSLPDGSAVRADRTWIRPGHCRRCVNGLGHRLCGRHKPSGVILQRQRKRSDDEISSDGGKEKLHRQVRHAEKRQWKSEAAAAIAERGAR